MVSSPSHSYERVKLSRPMHRKILLAVLAMLLLLWPLLHGLPFRTARSETASIHASFHDLKERYHAPDRMNMRADRVPQTEPVLEIPPARPVPGCSTSSKTDARISGVSGSLFTGTQQRNYTGPWLLTNLPAVSTPSTAVVNTATGPVSSNWAVCTTIFKPSEAIFKTVQLEGWAVVIVGDKGGTPFNLTAPNVVFLNATAQEQFLSTSRSHQRLLPLLPWKHFGRKNVGYLYAIAHGAERIWDFDDDNILRPGVIPAVPTSEVFHVQVNRSSCEAFNPYPLMGDPSTNSTAVPPSWPRGLPLDLIQKPCSYRLAAGNTSSVAVVQSLAQHDPDVDGIYRLTRGVPFYFDSSSRKTLIIPEGTLAPWNAQATLFLKPAFWSLLLPVTVHGRVSDIWRSYVAQRLLWDVGQRVAFCPPMVDQLRSPHNYLADMQAEEHLYYRSSQLVKLLRQWQGTAPSLAGRVEQLLVELYTRNYIELQDVQLAQQWLLALMASGYSFPDLLNPAAAPAATAAAGGLPLRPPVDAQSNRLTPGPTSDQRTGHKVLQRPWKSTVQPAARKEARWNASTNRYWAVVTTAQAPTQAIKQLAALDGWQVVVVADLATPASWSWPNVTYLGVEAQRDLPFAVLKHLLWNNAAARKNVGYLYAISQGAHVIYDVNDSNELLQEYVSMLTCSDSGSEITANISGMPCQGQYTVLDELSTKKGLDNVINPFPLFGQPQLQPKAMLSSTCSSSEASQARYCFKRQSARPLIQHALTNGYPGPHVDMLSIPGGRSQPVVFDKSAFSVVLPHGVMTTYSSSNTLFLRDALWALLLPVTQDQWLPSGR